MKAVLCQNSELQIVDLPDPVPGPGQVLVEVLRCGICGSDLHFCQHGDHLKALYSRVGVGEHFPGQSDPVVLGHELCGEVLDFGPGCNRKIKKGARVVAQPLLRNGAEFDILGWSTRTPGAYAERMILQEALLVEATNGLSAEMASLTEPIAVGWHAIRRSEIKKSDVAIVIGCGPVGLAIIGGLKARGVKTIVASDFSPARRELARRCGADLLIDPAIDSPFRNWQDYGFFMNMPGLLELAMGTREKLGKLPLPWWHVWRLAEALGQRPARPIIFECVGVPGVVQQLIDGAPLMSRIVVVGVCMQIDRYEPALALAKEIDLRFVFGHTPLEYRDSLHLIAEGRLNCQPLLTGEVGLEGVKGAFAELAQPDRHAKIVVNPGRMGNEIVPLGL